MKESDQTRDIEVKQLKNLKILGFTDAQIEKIKSNKIKISKNIVNTQYTRRLTEVEDFIDSILSRIDKGLVTRPADEIRNQLGVDEIEDNDIEVFNINNQDEDELAEQIESSFCQLIETANAEVCDSIEKNGFSEEVSAKTIEAVDFNTGEVTSIKRELKDIYPITVQPRKADTQMFGFSDIFVSMENNKIKETLPSAFGYDSDMGDIQDLLKVSMIFSASTKVKNGDVIISRSFIRGISNSEDNGYNEMDFDKADREYLRSIENYNCGIKHPVYTTARLVELKN